MPGNSVTGSRMARMRLIFPVSYLSSQLGMTGLLVVVGLAGNPHLAADIGIVQGAALALFFSFSGNVRNLILKPGQLASSRSLLIVRLMLLLPLGLGTYYLGSILGGVTWEISLVLIVRKSVEWLTEIHLSEAERDHDVSFSWRHFVVQSGLLVIAVVWVTTGVPGLMMVLAAWAVGPLVVSFSYFRRMFQGTGLAVIPGRMLLPHLGSSAVVGIGVYVFRLIILVLVDRVTAGNLFTAFAIGGALGSLFAAGLGPSLVLHEQKTGQRQIPEWLSVALVLTTLAGLAVIWVSYFLPNLDALTGKDGSFWRAVGLSLIGGVVMVFAQRQRLRDLQNGTEENVFAPDVLVNILIVAIIPFAFFSFDRDGLSWLYLFNAVVALAFYWMADPSRAEWIVGQRHANGLKTIIAVLLISPVFVTLHDGLFRSDHFSYDSGGVFGRLPIPLSVFGCYLGIVFLGHFRRANLGLAVIFISFVLMVLSSVATTLGNRPEEQVKLVLLMQYMLPMFGLVLGMMYEGREQKSYVAERAMLLVIAIVVPAQLLASWLQGFVWLSPYLYLISIYQHLQYVPIIVTGIYLVAAYSLWSQPTWRRLIIALAPAIGIYVAASASMLAIGFAFAGSVIFAIHCNAVGMDRREDGRAKAWMVTAFMLIFLATYYLCMRYLPLLVPSVFEHSTAWYTGKYRLEGMPNVQGRVEIWLFYLHGIFNDISSFLFGHGSPPDRKIWASAHNYYLDFVYNFGAIASLAIVSLLVFTFIQLYRYRSRVMDSSALLGLAMVVMFLLIPDNLLKVGMRQPYPGIVTFFLWGLLLSRLESLSVTYKPPNRSTSFL